MMFPVLVLKKPKDCGWMLESAELREGNTLYDMYELIDCRCVDVRTVEINGEEIDVWFDDEFLLRGEHPIPNLMLPNHELLCGNVLFAKHDDEGATVGLTKKDMDDIAKWLPSRIKALGKWLVANGLG